jgi:hypothetical protein
MAYASQTPPSAPSNINGLHAFSQTFATHFSKRLLPIVARMPRVQKFCQDSLQGLVTILPGLVTI